MKALFLLFAITAAAQTVPDNVLFEKDVQYSQGNRLAMDIARPKGDGPFPAIVAIHGGGFVGGERSFHHPTILKLAGRGYVAATVSYRLAPANMFPAAVQDVKAAVRFLRANAAKYAIDPERMAAIGGSAGGHLALMIGLTPGVPEFETPPNREQSSRVSAVVSYFPPTDFVRMYGKSSEAANVLPQFLGGTPTNAPGAHVIASPLHWVTPLAPPTLLIHGTDDRIVPFEQSQWLLDRLKSAGVRAELESIAGADHGFQGADAERAERRMMEFLDQNLGLAEPKHVVIAADHGPRGQIVAMEWPSGRELWTVPNGRGHDVQALPNGNILYTLGAEKKVVEMDASRTPVWTYSEGLAHPISAERLANGNTLIGDAELGKVIEIDPKGAIVWKYESPDLAKMRMRNSRRTAAGTTLISVEAAGKIIEVNQAGEIIWTFNGEGGPRRRPYQAHRLPNGNTLISMTSPGEIVEVKPDGAIVRSVAGAKPDLKLVWASGIHPLPHGGFLASDYLGRRLLEIDASGKVLHEVRMPTRTVASVVMAK